MSGSLSQAVERWHDFYFLAGGVAATLLGLLFTTMALRSGQAGVADLAVEHDLWAAASVPFACFLDIVLLSLAFLAPGQSALGLGLPMLVVAALASALLCWVWTRRWSLPGLNLHWRLLTVLACYLTQAAVAVAVLAGHTGPLWLVAVTFGGLILNAAVAAWDLLREPILAQARQYGASQAQMPDSRGGADSGQVPPP